MKKHILALLLAVGSAHAAEPTTTETWTRIGDDPIWEKKVVYKASPAKLYLMVMNGETHFAVGLPCKATGGVQFFQWKTAEDIGTTRKTCPDRPMIIRVMDWSNQLNPLPVDYDPRMQYEMSATQ